MAISDGRLTGQESRENKDGRRTRARLGAVVVALAAMILGAGAGGASAAPSGDLGSRSQLIAATTDGAVRGAIPVVDFMGHAIGIVSRTDLIAEGPTGQGGRSHTWGLLSRRARKARARSEASGAARLMARCPAAVGADAGVARAAYLM